MSVITEKVYEQEAKYFGFNLEQLETRLLEITGSYKTKVTDVLIYKHKKTKDKIKVIESKTRLAVVGKVKKAGGGKDEVRSKTYGDRLEKEALVNNAIKDPEDYNVIFRGRKFKKRFKLGCDIKITIDTWIDGMLEGIAYVEIENSNPDMKYNLDAIAIMIAGPDDTNLTTTTKGLAKLAKNLPLDPKEDFETLNNESIFRFNMRGVDFSKFNPDQFMELYECLRVDLNLDLVKNPKFTPNHIRIIREAALDELAVDVLQNPELNRIQLEELVMNLKSAKLKAEQELTESESSDSQYRTLVLPKLVNLEPTLESTTLKLAEEMGEFAQLVGKMRNLSGETNEMDQAELIRELTSELLDIAQTAVTQSYVLEEQYGIDLNTAIDDHIAKLKRKNYM